MVFNQEIIFQPVSNYEFATRTAHRHVARYQLPALACHLLASNTTKTARGHTLGCELGIRFDHIRYVN